MSGGYRGVWDQSGGPRVKNNRASLREERTLRRHRKVGSNLEEKAFREEFEKGDDRAKTP
jgi:hypothetical protein